MLDDELETSPDHEAPNYFAAREYMRRGDILGAFEALRTRGCIRETPIEGIDRAIAWDYASRHEKGLAANRAGDTYSATVLCPNESDLDRVTSAIRSELKRREVLSDTGVVCERIPNPKSSVAQIGNYSIHEPGQFMKAYCRTDDFFLAFKNTFDENPPISFVRLSLGNVTPSWPDIDQTTRRGTNPIEFCIGDRVCWEPNGTDFIPNFRDSTYRVTHVGNNYIDITPEQPVDHLEDFPVCFRSGFLTHAYCHTPDSIRGKSFNCVFNYHSGQIDNPLLMEQLRKAVHASREECYTFTPDAKELQQAVIDMSRQQAATRLQCERHAIDQASLRDLSLDNNFFNRGAFNHER